MKKVSADADYIISQTNPQEYLHERAMRVASQLGQVRIVTSGMVLTEALTFLAEKGSRLRTGAASMVDSLRHNRNVVIVPQTSRQFEDALLLYRRRLDKEWSLTDSASFLIMQKQNIREALTHDIHFLQAGFKALLREGA